MVCRAAHSAIGRSRDRATGGTRPGRNAEAFRAVGTDRGGAWGPGASGGTARAQWGWSRSDRDAEGVGGAGGRHVRPAWGRMYGLTSEGRFRDVRVGAESRNAASAVC